MVLNRIWHWAARVRQLLAVGHEIAETKMLIARLLVDRLDATEVPRHLRDVEFKVFSQFGEDGIIQYLIRRAGIPRERRCFVEFGVESYTEANTRFLLMNDNWRGLIIDGSEAHMAAVRGSQVYWRHDLTAVAAFVDAVNINGLIANAGYAGEVGLLSIDVDGMDYWIWEKIDVVDPIIVVIEYNSVFGAKRAVTVPYDARFTRTAAHHSNLYWGCSLKAVELLGKRKGYALVGSNSAGNNAFLVRRDRLNGQPEVTAEEAYVESRFRESRDKNGRLTYLSGPARLREIGDLIAYDVEYGRGVRLRELET